MILDLPHVSTDTAQKPPVSERHPRSNIGRLPKKVRDQLNLMIQDGLPYDAIKQNLGVHGENLIVGMISDWKTHGGYEPWRREQIWREEMGARIESFSDLLTDADPAQISTVGLQISLAQLCEQLRDLGPGSRKEQFENDAATYLRLLNTMARLAKSSLALQQYRDAAAKAATVQPKIAEPKGLESAARNGESHAEGVRH